MRFGIGNIDAMFGGKLKSRGEAKRRESRRKSRRGGTACCNTYRVYLVREFTSFSSFVLPGSLVASDVELPGLPKGFVHGVMYTILAMLGVVQASVAHVPGGFQDACPLMRRSPGPGQAGAYAVPHRRVITTGGRLRLFGEEEVVGTEYVQSTPYLV